MSIGNDTYLLLSPNSFKENIDQKNKVLIARSLLVTIFVFLCLVTSKNVIKSLNNLYEKFKLVIPGNLPILGPLQIVAWHGNGAKINYTNSLKCLSFLMDKPLYTTKILGKEFAILSDPKLIKKLFGSNDPGHLSKSNFVYDNIYCGILLEGLIVNPVHVWKPHRTIMSKAFTYESLKSYLPILNLHSEELVSELMKVSYTDYPVSAIEKETKKDVTFVELIHMYTLRMIAHIAAGSDVIKDGEGLIFHRNVSKFKELAPLKLFNPLLHLPLVSRMHPISREYKKVYGEVEAYLQNLIHQKRNEDKSNDTTSSEFKFKSTLEILMNAELNDREILAEVGTFIIAGHETISMALNFLMFNLALNPEHQNACREEVDNAFEDISALHCSDGENCCSSLHKNLTIDSLNSMNYLERCIKENLRIFPIVPGLPRRLDSPLKFGDDSSQELLGAGTEIIGSVWGIHRNPKFYPEPDKFDPARFLPENSRCRSSYSFLPFSHGPRNCIGWKLAMYEMKIISAWILRHFEVYTSDKFSDVQIFTNVTIEPKKPINIYLKQRKFV